MRRECHPLLSGGRTRESKHNHGLSSAEMESLASLCETILPSLPPPVTTLDGKQNQPTKAVQALYRASGSQTPMPDEIAELLMKRGLREAVFLVRLVLWLLSTRLGTFLLCGSLCFGERWLCIKNFSSISLDKREKVLQKWFKRRFFTPIRAAFVYVKVLCVFVFFSRVGQNGDNPAWEAIEYCAGTDENPDQVPKERPLQKGLIDTNQETDSTLLRSLTEKGLEVTRDPRRNLCKIKCDVVIVGSGCGGGVAAAVLAASGQKVFVLEKGNYFTATDYSGLEGPSLAQLYESGGLLTSADAEVIIMAGSAVGGGSVVNWSASIKTPNSVLQEWTKNQKIPLFGSPEYLSAMDTVCARIGVTENLILTGCKAERFILENNKGLGKRKQKCLGVIAKIINNNIITRLQIEAKVTISACGALLTPPLMISSGLKNQNIGRNLHLHPVLMAWGYFPESNSEFKGKVYDGGIITAVYEVVAGDSTVRAIVETPGLGPSSFSVLCPWVSGHDMKNRMMKYSRTAHLITIIRDSGSGKVTTEGRISYHLDASDRDNLKVGLRQALRILVAAGAVEVGTHRSDGQRIKCRGIKKEDLEEFLDTVYATRGAMSPEEDWMFYSSAHQMGSCRMGLNEKEGAVDENGESWEAEGLFVCDASVLPSAVGVNPMITIQSTAYCLSQKIAESLRKD
ncbi:hypothetical protein D5086_016921 [Populus alba]|uniref:Uncharacterized protein n=1 Tax=Populus alba TaxID=43335 RepID=A0ACC4BVP2_POPAL